MKNRKHELGNEDFSIELNADWHGKNSRRGRLIITGKYYS